MRKKTIAAVGIITAQTVALVSTCIKRRGNYKGRLSDLDMIQEASLGMYGMKMRIVPEKTVTVDGQDIHIVFNPYILVAKNIGIAMYAPGSNVMFVDALFMDMSEDTQKFIIGHEAGHLHYGHKAGTGYGLRRWLLTAVENGIQTMEEDADAYAVKAVFGHLPYNERCRKAAKALHEIASVLSDTVSKKELRLRAKVWEDKLN